MDHLTKSKRSWNMSLIRAKNTKPEILVRKILRKAGYKYSTYKKNLPGKPDIVLTKYKIVIFVHGCFWHQHKSCKRANIPKSNREFWIPKFDRNVKKDKLNVKELKKKGWKIITVWECQIKDDPIGVRNILIKKLDKNVDIPHGCVVYKNSSTSISPKN